MADKLPCSLINPKTQIQEYCLGNPSEGVQVVDLQIHHQTPTFDHQNGQGKWFSCPLSLTKIVHLHSSIIAQRSIFRGLEGVSI